ncbi:hypothetical protein [Hymenobacter terricola]|uniref:hypothetical protein n=1 Tax=Hymenobacter terricola TaxID=2819236 RepID=UPI001B316742|nr:hypothetical protein [Hymenobacter terricola]
MDLIDFHFASAIALAYAVLKWLLMGLMVSSSRIWNYTGFAAPLVVGILLLGVGVVFKIEHWAFGRELLFLGAALFVAVYGWWCYAKKHRNLLDYLKLMWVIGVGATVLALAVWPALIQSVAGCTEALFWAMGLLFVHKRWIRRPDPTANL